MKLEVGMYVKTKKGYIYKLSRYEEDNNRWISFEENDWYSVYESLVTKASHNIIDLIEEKDLLEIEYFSLRYEKRVTRLFEVTYKEGRFINLENAKCQFMLIDNDWTDNDKKLEPIIKSIVTKEQFESMSYKVGE